MEDMRQRYQVALAATYVKVKEELTEQYRDDLNRFAVQTLAASNATTNRLLAELVESIDTMQAQDLNAGRPGPSADRAQPHAGQDAARRPVCKRWPAGPKTSCREPGGNSLNCSSATSRKNSARSRRPYQNPHGKERTMTPSRKICLCLALSDRRGNWRPAATPRVKPRSPRRPPVVAYPQPVAPRTTGAVVPVRYTGWSFPGSDENPVIESPLVIPAGEMTVEATGQIIEDLSIMARIIEKNVLDNYNIRRFVYAGHVRARHAPVGPRARRCCSLRPGGPSPCTSAATGPCSSSRSISLSWPPPETAKAQPAEARGRPGLVPDQAIAAGTPLDRCTAGTGRDRVGSLINQGKVDSLRKSLIAVMKQAANIRALGPERIADHRGPGLRLGDPGSWARRRRPGTHCPRSARRRPAGA